MEELSNCSEDAAAELTSFLNNLGDLIWERDITEKKNSLSLKIEIPKFKGYESDMDIYPFSN